MTAQLGGRLRRLRRERGLSLDALAQLTGVSKPMLGQVERGASSPTVATLWKIATGLRVPFTALLQESVSAEFVARDDQPAITEDGGRFQVFSTYAAPGGPVELFRVVLLPGCMRDAQAHAAGVSESVTVYAGRLTVSVPDASYHLDPGDTLQFAADVPHSYANPHDAPCTAHMAIFYAGGTPGGGPGVSGGAPLRAP